MPHTESGSDGESGEKPVRERLKQTTIAKNAVEGESAPAEGEDTEMRASGSAEARESIENTNDAPRKRPGRKRSLENVSGADAQQDTYEGAPATPSSGGHLRKRYREVEAGEGDGAELSKMDPEVSEKLDNSRSEGDDAEGSVAMHTPPQESKSDSSAKVLSPTRKRSRENLDNEDREQKIPATDVTRARRSSDEERPVLPLSDEGSDKLSSQTVANGSVVSPDNKAGSVKDGSKPIPAGSGFSNTSAVSPFGTLSTSKSATNSPPAEPLPVTSKAAFASSGFASMTGSTSPFGAIGAGSSSKGPSVSSKPATFGSIPGTLKSDTTSTSTTTSVFGSGSTSGFGTLGGSAFGSKTTTSVFGGGPKLASFAAPVGDTKLGTAAKIKPIGSPPGEDDDSGSNGDNEGTEKGEDGESRGDRASVAKSEEPEAKLEIQENLDTGEEGEETIFTQTAKLFQFDTDSGAWKERGVGSVKVNIPKTDTAKEEETNQGSTDPSEANEAKDSSSKTVPRLVMRQRDTYKLILNTPIFKEMHLKREGKVVRFTAPINSDSTKLVPQLLRVGKEPEMEAFCQKVEDLQKAM